MIDAQRAVGIVIQLLVAKRAEPGKPLADSIRAIVDRQEDPLRIAVLFTDITLQIAAKVLETQEPAVAEAFLEMLAAAVESTDA